METINGKDYTIYYNEKFFELYIVVNGVRCKVLRASVNGPLARQLDALRTGHDNTFQCVMNGIADYQYVTEKGEVAVVHT